MLKFRAVFSVFVLFLVAACSDPSSDPVESINAHTYVSPEHPSITVMTMVNENGDFGEHTGLLINASQQVLYDPAGTFRSVNLARARDVHYGMTPYMVQYYKSYHARFGYYVVAQKLEVSPEIAEELFRRAVAQGTTGQLRCALSASSVLNGIPMFSSIPTTYFPGKIMEEFAKLPGVETSYTREYDVGQNYLND